MREVQFTMEERKKLVADFYRLRSQVEDLTNQMEENPGDEALQVRLDEEYDRAMAELEEISETYTNGLPRIEISRCPFTGESYSFSCDTNGLDGPWWDAEKPLRAVDEESETYYALTGSVNIIGAAPDIPFAVKPGPAVPWVSPRLLENEDICAVLSHLKVGLYDAYVVVYFSKDRSYEIERINTWGTDAYFSQDIDGAAVMGSTFDEPADYDFDIAPWIEKGKLKWIPIGDKTLELQDSIENCPYLDIDGYTYPVLLRNKILENSMITLDLDDEEVSEEKEINFCPECGADVEPESNFCAKCGHKLR
ncbi:zinc-ribbon domain-containing protein [Aureitalea sp. L0-47]|uniref:zinc ribbon domain-containing protein n=1 Tax=Aureitalea sp. L0-47 TaxID=2816962 RepID=UPI002238F956|nr:zinc-ribbon domain-containing protein [Aureitalea sp. L0-47]MCW5520566.1 zinc-ribbon domain-containing protein [Aureitalea sp. L0-47]